MKKSELIRINEAAKILQISRSTLYKWIDEGYIKTVKFGLSPMIEKKEVERIEKL